MGDAFLQSAQASVLQKLVLANTKLSAFDQSEVATFLQGKMQGSSGEIVGILEQMKEQMAADLKEAEETEASAIADNTARVGELAVAIVNAKNDLEDTKDALAEDTSYLAELKKTCAEQVELFAQVKKMRAQELEAIGATVKILNDDDALDLFKKTLPSPALVQESLLQVNAKVSNKQRVKALLRERPGRGPHAARARGQEGRLREDHQDDGRHGGALGQGAEGRRAEEGVLREGVRGQRGQGRGAQ